MYTQYLREQDGTIRFSGPIEKMQRLEAGIYQVTIDNFGTIMLNTFTPETDGLIELPNSPAKDINAKVGHFLSDEVRESFDRYNILYKRGLLMYGVPGTGKTSIIHMLMKTAVDRDMVVLLGIRPHLVSAVVSSIRGIEHTERPVMVVWEEFEEWVDNSEGDLLNLLDGAEQLGNMFYVATTNYIEEIPSRIRNRPSRFAEVVEIGPPNAELREAFIRAKIHPEDEININEWVEKTDGFTIDHIKDLIVSVLVLKVPFEEAIDKLNRLNNEDEFYDMRDSSGTVGDINSMLEKKLASLRHAKFEPMPEYDGCEVKTAR